MEQKFDMSQNVQAPPEDRGRYDDELRRHAPRTQFTYRFGAIERNGISTLYRDGGTIQNLNIQRYLPRLKTYLNGLE